MAGAQGPNTHPSMHAYTHVAQLHAVLLGSRCAGLHARTRAVPQQMHTRTCTSYRAHAGLYMGPRAKQTRTCRAACPHVQTGRRSTRTWHAVVQNMCRRLFWCTCVFAISLSLNTQYAKHVACMSPMCPVHRKRIMHKCLSSVICCMYRACYVI